MAGPFTYSKAVVCGIPASLPAAALRMCEPGHAVDLARARAQHHEYVGLLKRLVKEVVELPADERFPDCVFVEDPVVVVDSTALITIPGHASRRGETVALRGALVPLGLHVVEMAEPGHMDGGDVLFTGREFFVGLSQRTNQDGISQLANAFPAYPVTSISVKEGLHLKSFTSMAGPDLIAMGTSDAAQSAQRVMETEGRFRYQFLPVPDDTAANCLLLNGTLLHSSKEAFPNSSDAFDGVTGCEKVAMSTSELNKVDGCFTCCSLLIK